MDAKLTPLFKEAVDAGKLPGISACIINTSGDALYHSAFGLNDITKPTTTHTTSTPVIMWSTTKLVACVAALQLLEQGRLSLSDPVEKYVPEIANIQVMDGKDSVTGKVKLRPARTKATILNCMTHTAGFTYDFFDQSTLDWVLQEGRTPSSHLPLGKMECFTTPLIADPGSQYTYGVNIDWLGFVIEAITGQSLKEYVHENIVLPLGMKDTVAHFANADSTARLVVHAKDEQGKLTPMEVIVPAENPDKFGGGHYLVSTLDDYSTFLLAILNKGVLPGDKGKRILETQTVERYLFTDMIPEVGCGSAGLGAIDTATVPALTGTGKMLPGVKLGWSCGFLLNLEDTGYGRKAGSGQWA